MWLSLVSALTTMLALVLLTRRRGSVRSSEDANVHGRAVVTTLAVVVLLVATPPVATVVLAVVIVGVVFITRLTRQLLVTVAAVSYLLLITWTVVSQIVHRYPVTLDWPGRFDSWGSLAWVSVGLVAIAGWMNSDPDDCVHEK